MDCVPSNMARSPERIHSEYVELMTPRAETRNRWNGKRAVLSLAIQIRTDKDPIFAMYYRKCNIPFINSSLSVIN